MSPPSTLRTVGPAATTSPQPSRRSRLAVAGMRMPPRLLRSPISSDGSTRSRSVVMRIDCLASSSGPTIGWRLPPAPRPTCFESRWSPRLDSPRPGSRRAAGRRARPQQPPPAAWRPVADPPDVAQQTAPAPQGVESERWQRRTAVAVGAYVRLTKPRVIELLLVTTVPAMILAAGELPSIRLIVEVLIGGTLAAGGANTLNCWIERD